ncbi:hypothetical protein PPERSA_11668 [Pseudocohnilembus persalinus]|uniref:Uncharacterized protein n=1 Tax=Pseudocohnilembus persalinus TaxID=266149 RepID=A0A0V0QA74_PSEPJ|nr:hypothetical protein PPERSA_11668 [Pseudocohnilembus persalinus]|eukprot:KRW99067.1 hypothetical protein PPERSA_11668 [Pseudocohnilembus persalinus]
MTFSRIFYYLDSTLFEYTQFRFYTYQFMQKAHQKKITFIFLYKCYFRFRTTIHHLHRRRLHLSHLCQGPFYFQIIRDLPATQNCRKFMVIIIKNYFIISKLNQFCFIPRSEKQRRQFQSLVFKITRLLSQNFGCYGDAQILSLIWGMKFPYFPFFYGLLKLCQTRRLQSQTITNYYCYYYYLFD